MAFRKKQPTPAVRDRRRNSFFSTEGDFTIRDNPSNA